MEEGKRYVGWEEVVVSNDKGRRVVHYYLKDATGGSDLAVVGKERSLRHMSYAVPGRFRRSLLAARWSHLGSPSPSPSPSYSPPPPPDGCSLKWRSRREVVDWLSSVADSASHGSSPMVDRFLDEDDADATDFPTSKVPTSGKLGHHSTDFSWLGSAWNCRKRRKHYRSFCRKGITISVHDFVFVMSEESKRLVAYVEDLYEDLRANNMVVVRWFHKVDEVGAVLPPDVNDREIFFSLCLQDFSVECIDGLAAVLGAQHFEKFQSEIRHSIWQPYLCCRQFVNDDLKPFDVTQLQGYWSQEVLRSMFTPSLKVRLKIPWAGSDHASQVGQKRKHLFITDSNITGAGAKNADKSEVLGVESNGGGKFPNNAPPSSGLLKKVLMKHKPQQQQLSPGCHVEVLSQDSGIRGCWFRCVILKRHSDKVKVRYEDVQDADETGNLKEWVLLSRVAAPDEMGVRLSGRSMVRPCPSSSQESKDSGDDFDVGSVVDAWWHDGWWEGIVVGQESEGQCRIYFPGEKQVSVFGKSNLRHSWDWISNMWNPLKDRKDIADLLLRSMGSESIDMMSEPKLLELPLPDPEMETQKECFPDDECKVANSTDTPAGGTRDAVDLAKDLQHGNLKWNLSKKRKRRRFDSTGHKRHSDTSSGSSQEEAEESSACGGFVLLQSLTVDQENCKIGGDPLFGTPMAMSSLVMSR